MITWFLMNLLSTCVSLFGIYKINQTVNDLKILEPKLKTNHWMQSLHGLLLVLQLSAVGIATVVEIYYDYTSADLEAYYSTFITCTAIDLLVQSIIVYICWVQGSDSGLTRHECYIWTDRFGLRRLKFKLRASFESKDYKSSLISEFTQSAVTNSSINI